MWCVALLVNTSTWVEFKHNWKLICIVFLELHQGSEHVNNEHQDALLDRICKIKSDTNAIHAINASAKIENEEEENHVFSQDPYDFDDDIDITRNNARSIQRRSNSNKVQNR